MYASSSRTRSSTPSFRATSNWARRQATGHPACYMTRSRAAPRPTSRLRKKCSRVTQPDFGEDEMHERRPALGKGLSALIPDVPEPSRQGALEVDIDLIAPNGKQPRVQMDDAKLDELARSIKENGVIQPILVQRIGDLYRIIAGERRWRAPQRPGLLKAPVVVREVPVASDQQLLPRALIENIHRENLNPGD